MLTPVDVQNKVFKGGIGFDKKDVEAFMNELSSDYGMLYRSNVELKDKVTTLNESLQHYRSIEDSMQKALTLSEKTAEETINAANDKARQLNLEAEKKAEAIIADAKEELLETKNDIYRLQQQYIKFKAQFTKVLESQLKLMDGEMIDIDLGPDFQADAYNDNGFGNFSGGGLGSEGSLGGLGGGYAGSGNEGFERTNQDPAFNRGSLNMDPFADAMSGGGRFSKQTGKAYNGANSTKKKKSTSKSDSKSSLNVKETKSGANKVKKNFSTASDSISQEKLTATASAEKQVNTTSSSETELKDAVPNTISAQAAATANQTNAAATPYPSDGKSQAANVQRDSEDDSIKISGEVEDKVNESNMLDSEDNYSDGFDFVVDEAASIYEDNDSVSEENKFFDHDTVSGEVEDKINESNMLDSEDNYSDGFDFIVDEATESTNFKNFDENTYSGEVEDKINESNMLDSEDNYSDGFDFVVGNESEEDEIPTIFPDISSIQPNMFSAEANFSETENTNLNLNPFHENENSEDILTGDVEDNINQSNLIGNADDEDEGFNFL